MTLLRALARLVLADELRYWQQRCEAAERALRARVGTVKRWQPGERWN